MAAVDVTFYFRHWNRENVEVKILMERTSSAERKGHLGHGCITMIFVSVQLEYFSLSGSGQKRRDLYTRCPISNNMSRNSGFLDQKIGSRITKLKQSTTAVYSVFMSENMRSIALMLACSRVQHIQTIHRIFSLLHQIGVKSLWKFAWGWQSLAV